jgi:hypothetical protein
MPAETKEETPPFKNEAVKKANSEGDSKPSSRMICPTRLARLRRFDEVLLAHFLVSAGGRSGT